jgi:hypothetical protein
MKGILQEIAMQKDIIDRLRLKFDHDIQESQKSFSEKADLLSRYIEDEIKRSADLIKSQHNQSKEMITKIAESLKTTILNNEKSKSEIVKKIGKLEGLLQATKTDLNSTLEVTDNRYVSKMRELQQSLENHVMINTRVLETRIETLAGMVESSLSSFEASLLSNREVFSEIINKLNSEISENHSVICRDLQKIVSEISSFQEEIDSLSETVHENLQKTSNFISSIESKSLVLLTNEKIVRENLINRVSEDFDERVKEFEEKVENFEERLNEEEKIQQGNDDKNNEKFKEITEKLKKIKNVVKGSKTGDLLIQEEKDRNKIFKETRNLLNEMMGSVETLTLQKEIEDLSELNFIHQGEITQLKEALKKKVSKLKLQQNKLTDENKLLIEEIFDRKVAGIQEKLKRDNESLWSRTQEKATKRKTSSPQDSVDLTERISSIARTEKESTKARLRL